MTDQQGRKRSNLDARFRMSSDELERERRAAEAAGREMWNRGTRTGENFRAATPSELEALGRSARKGGALRELGLQIDTGVRGAADVLMLGQADEFSAAADTLFDGRGAENWRQRYEANLRRQTERDRFDEAHRAPARALGELAGAALLYKSTATPVMDKLDRLSPYKKGQVGETLSRIKAIAQGDWPLKGQLPVQLSKGYTRVDVPTARGKLVEAKFGPSAKLSKQQRKAVEELGPRYIVDWWRKEHVGRPAGGAAAGSGWVAEKLDERD